MSFIYSQTRDPYCDVLTSGRGELSLSSKHHSPSYFDAPGSLHHPDLKVVDSIEHDLKREYELEARRNYERERELEDEREVVGRGYLHEREELERERRAELERDRRIDIRDRFERPQIRARNTKVVVDNLPYSVKWPEFKEFMKKVGEVVFADVFMDNTGKSKGCGIVEYANIESADRAMSDLDGQWLDEERVSCRRITVSIRTGTPPGRPLTLQLLISWRYAESHSMSSRVSPLSVAGEDLRTALQIVLYWIDERRSGLHVSLRVRNKRVTYAWRELTTVLSQSSTSQ